MSGSSPTPPTVSGGGSSIQPTSTAPAAPSTAAAPATAPATALCVVQPFGDYTAGQIITDAPTVFALKGMPGVVSIAWPMPSNTPAAS